MVTRRSFIVIAGLAGLGLISPLKAETLPLVTVHKDPNCGCCGTWAEHLKSAGFSVKVDETDAVWAIKQQLGVPQDLASCHTAEVGGYVVEGHVPASAIIRLLKEKPEGKGLAVPGMPVGSPGMEVEGQEPETYDVILFGSGKNEVFARYKGAELI